MAAGLVGGLMAVALRAAPAPAVPPHFVTIDAPGVANGTITNGINVKGQIVGDFPDAHGKLHGFLWNRGVFTKMSRKAPAFRHGCDTRSRE